MTPSDCTASRFLCRSAACRPAGDRSRRGFTLVEMLVVITIIGILAALTVGGVWRAVIRGKNVAITMELSQLEMACQEYKNKFGEYPPDFTGLDSTDPTVRDASQKAILRHLAKAFPRYRPGISTDGDATPVKDPWEGFVADVQKGWNLHLSYRGQEGGSNLSPTAALTFWLGGKPDWLPNPSGDTELVDGVSSHVVSTQPITKFSGFSANPANPFDGSAARIPPFYEFSPHCLKLNNSKTAAGLSYWPTSACDQGSYPIVYFRASNNAYYQDGSTTIPKSWGRVFAAIDTRLSTGTKLGWINPKGVQIFSSGRDLEYGALRTGTTTPAAPQEWSDFLRDLTTNACLATGANLLAYPKGLNYAPETFDDITNFSGGTLEDQIPQ